MKIQQFYNILDEQTNEQHDLILKQLNTIPLRFQQEFIEDVIVDKYSIMSFNKCVNYFLEDIYSELSEKERNQMFMLL